MIHFHPLVRRDAKQALRYYDRISRKLGDDFWAKLEDAIHRLEASQSVSVSIRQDGGERIYAGFPTMCSSMRNLMVSESWWYGTLAAIQCLVRSANEIWRDLNIPGHCHCFPPVRIGFTGVPSLHCPMLSERGLMPKASTVTFPVKAASQSASKSRHMAKS